MSDCAVHGLFHLPSYDKNENRQKHFIFEGFRQKRLQNRIQRIFLRIVALVKIDLGHFSKMNF